MRGCALDEKGEKSQPSGTVEKPSRMSAASDISVRTSITAIIPPGKLPQALLCYSYNSVIGLFHTIRSSPISSSDSSMGSKQSSSEDDSSTPSRCSSVPVLSTLWLCSLPLYESNKAGKSIHVFTLQL